ncbi:MAG: PDZ domain-containing protein [Acidobacteria bacterium]|nr:PDZ domain-containing protein [Acidobacteriota bacterium]
MQEQFENNEISRLLGGLDKVEAPGDFDFRLKARIAAGRPVESAPTFGWLKAAVPLVLLLGIGGYFGYRAFRAQPVAERPRVAEAPNTVQPGPVVTEPSVIPQAENPIVASSEPKKDNSVPRLDKGKGAAPKAAEMPGGGSFEEAQIESNRVYPKGVDPRKAVDTAKPPMAIGRLPLSSVLSIAGVNGAMNDGGWRVSSVVDKSMAARAGVKADDVIEAINDQPIKANMDLPANFALKSLRVKRGGNTVTIPLKN